MSKIWCVSPFRSSGMSPARQLRSSLHLEKIKPPWERTVLGRRSKRVVRENAEGHLVDYVAKQDREASGQNTARFVSKSTRHCLSTTRSRENVWRKKDFTVNVLEVKVFSSTEKSTKANSGYGLRAKTLLPSHFQDSPGIESSS